jgi:hypothetical protein
MCLYDRIPGVRTFLFRFVSSMVDPEDRRRKIRKIGQARR